MNAKARKDKAKKVTRKATVSKAAKVAKTKKSTAKKTVAKKKASKVTAKTKVSKKKTITTTKPIAKSKSKPQTKAKSKVVAAAKTKSKPVSEVSNANISDPNNLVQGSFIPYSPKSDESYMSDSQLQHFRNILQDWKQELMSEVDETIKELKEAGIRRVPADPNDRASQEENFSVELRTRDRERKLIKKIEDALKMIDNKEYGYCESCGEEIGLRRLEARPTAFLCIDCKTLDEIREKRNA